MKKKLKTKSNYFSSYQIRDAILQQEDQVILDLLSVPVGTGAHCERCRQFNPWVQRKDFDSQYICYPCRYKHE